MQEIRVLIIDIRKPLSSEVYDEAILPICEVNNFIKKYMDFEKYRIITV